MDQQSLSYWAGAYTTLTTWWGGFFSPLIIWGDGLVSCSNNFLDTQWSPATQTLSWSWQPINDTTAQASIVFSESGNVFTFSGTINPRPQDGPVGFTGTRGSTLGNTLPPLPITAGRTVFYTGLAQSSSMQYINVTAGSGTSIITLTGAALPPAFTAAPLGEGFFTAADATGKYTVTIGTNNGQNWSQVLCCYQYIGLSPASFYHQFVFVSDDSGDADFNDSYFTLYWFDHDG